MTNLVKFKQPTDTNKGFLRNEYETPQWFFDVLNREFKFTHDLAASDHNAKCESYLSDSLGKDWHKLGGWLWLNPPYSPLKGWIIKAQQEAREGAQIVMLVPNICLATRYLYDHKPTEVRLIVGRINFFYKGVEHKGNASDVCLLIFNGKNTDGKVSWILRDKLQKESA